jgi:hypothetical protein
VKIKVRDDNDKPVLREVKYRPRKANPKAWTDFIADGMKELKRKNIKERRQKRVARERRKREGIVEMYR